MSPILKIVSPFTRETSSMWGANFSYSDAGNSASNVLKRGVILQGQKLINKQKLTYCDDDFT
jgi:hypothetical protein